MAWLNYHHLHYFWTVAHEGSVTAAAAKLRLSPSTISTQVRELESSLGQKLLRKSGRNLVLTETGRMALRYADEIFSLGRELQDAVAGHNVRRRHLLVGIDMVVPKQITHHILEPVLEDNEHLDGQKIHLVCHEGRGQDLLARLAVHQLDVVITDAALGPDSRVRAFNNLLGSSGVDLVGSPEIAERMTTGWPDTLNQAPLLLPLPSAAMRRHIDRWLDERNLHPDIVGEFEDSALMKVFGSRGVGLFPVAHAVSDEICEIYGLDVAGSFDGILESFFAITIERQIKHPGIIAITTGAEDRVFS